MKSSILFAVVASLFTITEAASGFKDSYGSWQKSRLDLNNCIINRDQILYAQQDGGFGSSAGICTITFAGLTTMECFLYGSSPNPGPLGYSNVLDLNDFIGNDNGVLRCFDRWGTKV
ncbi:hypothetical protein INS49_005764 [Diaporthe citri]|uniref:uncharacterized protein n=1 Tax=Diaporthe citri TaxID=83186 RepID=UPI001C7F202E|nr:uncharacterized protein INS49_005764 [Diaporthe citri]KAG6364166.1 hypothetical protein INS49_005764 [Diaporthe citri]